MQINTGSETAVLQRPAPVQQLALTPPETPSGDEDAGFQPFGEDGLGFFDFLDIINPLQHLPFVGPMYRELTGDELAAAPRMMGGTLYFGPIGLVGSAIDVVLEELTGNDLGGNIMAMLGERDNASDDGAATTGAEIVETPTETVSIQAGEPTAVGTDAADPVTAWAMAELSYRQAQAKQLGLSVPAKPYSRLLSEAPVPAAQPAAPATSELQAHFAAERTQIGAIQPDNIRRANAAYRAADLSLQRLDTEQAQRRSGSIADNGGWFTAAMLDALAKSPPQSIAPPETPSSPNRPSSLN